MINFTKLIFLLIGLLQVIKTNTATEPKYMGSGGYLRSQWFTVDTESTDSHIFITLNIPELNAMLKRNRRDYIRNLVRSMSRSLVLIEAVDKDIVINRKITYIPQENLHLFSRGEIPINITNLISHEGFTVRVGVKTDYRERRVLGEEEGLDFTHLATTSRLDANNSHEVYMSANWVTAFEASGLFTILGYAMRILVILIQILLVMVRPCIAKKNTFFYDWTMSMSSSMFSFQYILISGVMAENFGGPLNNALENYLRTSRARFVDKFTSTTMNKLDGDFEKAGYWKLSQNHFIASPLFEDYLGLFLLTFSICGCLFCGIGGSNTNSVMKKMRIGASMAFMIPLLLSSVNCIYAVFWGGIYTFGAMLSVAVSIMIMIYYLMFCFELMGNNPKSQYYKSSYRHINLDMSIVYAKHVIKNFEFFFYWVMTVTAVLAANLSVIPIGVSAFSYLCMLICNVITPRRDRVRIKYSEMTKILFLKSADFFLRAALFGLLFIFMWFRTQVKSLGVKTITTIAFIALFVDFLLNWGIFMVRAVGTFKDGLNKSHGGFVSDENNGPNGDYTELEDQEARDAEYAKQGGGGYA